MKSNAQTQRAIAQRSANDAAKLARDPLPYPNPWDAMLPKLSEAASLDERVRWAGDFMDRCAPKR